MGRENERSLYLVLSSVVSLAFFVDCCSFPSFNVLQNYLQNLNPDISQLGPSAVNYQSFPTLPSVSIYMSLHLLTLRTWKVFLPFSDQLVSSTLFRFLPSHIPTVTPDHPVCVKNVCPVDSGLGSTPCMINNLVWDPVQWLSLRSISFTLLLYKLSILIPF